MSNKLLKIIRWFIRKTSWYILILGMVYLMVFLTHYWLPFLWFFYTISASAIADWFAGYWKQAKKELFDDKQD